MFGIRTSYLYIILVLSILLLLFFILVAEYGLMTIMLVLAAFSGYLIIRRNDISDLVNWSEQKGFKVYRRGKRKEINNRLEHNSKKRYCDFREYKGVTTSGPYVEGKFGNRLIWIYPIFGLSGKSSGFHFKGWCMEISTSKIPIYAEVSRAHMGHLDSIDTESNEFEKLYRIRSEKKAVILQLLDPVMMSLVKNSTISSIEFSEESIVLISTYFPPKIEVLDTFLEIGKEIAEQVKRNFPVA